MRELKIYLCKVRGGINAVPWQQVAANGVVQAHNMLARVRGDRATRTAAAELASILPPLCQARKVATMHPMAASDYNLINTVIGKVMLSDPGVFSNAAYDVHLERITYCARY